MEGQSRKKIPQMDDGFKVLTKVYFNPRTLHIISIQALNIFSIQFWYKNLFFLFFLVSNLRKEREKSLDFRGGEKISFDTDFKSIKWSILESNRSSSGRFLFSGWFQVFVFCFCFLRPFISLSRRTTCCPCQLKFKLFAPIDFLKKQLGLPACPF